MQRYYKELKKRGLNVNQVKTYELTMMMQCSAEFEFLFKHRESSEQLKFARFVMCGGRFFIQSGQCYDGEKVIRPGVLETIVYDKRVYNKSKYIARRKLSQLRLRNFERIAQQKQIQL